MDSLTLTKEAKIYRKGKTISLIIILGNWPTTYWRMKLKQFLAPYTKTNSKWIKDLNVRQEGLKLLEEYIGRTLSDINHSKILYDPLPLVTEIKAKMNTWDLSFEQWRKPLAGKKAASEEEKKNRKLSNWQLISKIYKQLMQLNTRKLNNRIKNEPKN